MDACVHGKTVFAGAFASIYFGSKNVVFSGATPVNLRQDFHTVKLGINYHFGKGGI